MAEIALKVASGVALATGNPGAAFALGLASGTVGTVIDNNIFGGSGRNIEGPRLSDLSVQSSSYGKMIPNIYGSARVAGNVIWSLPIKETATTTTVSTGGKGGGGSSQSATEFSYSVTLAIAIGEGVVDEILRFWADSLVINPDDFSGSYRFYRGDSSQLPDPTIESIEGVGNTPAYRNLAYLVIEDFPLEAFGNRIPNFTFEIKRSVENSGLEGRLEDNITGMTLIPGSGEFVYDTKVQSKVEGELVNGSWQQVGTKTRINQTNNDNKANALVALDQLQNTLPNLEWVSVVVTWFGNDLDAGVCTIKPGVEFKTDAITEPDLWSVGSFDRSTALQITLDSNNSPVYGGTPSDNSILNFLTELKNRGYKIMFYPMFFMDTANKPWRGRVTGTATDVANFFTKSGGYNEFINHYINLVVGKVDAFVIGSELIGLTSVNDGGNNFPAVDALVNVAATAKTALGSGVKVTYAADWSEYHHEENGWYNLDKLWASPDIDMVGIDAYFPLTDEPQNGYDVAKVIAGWDSGEGYDWYYSDVNRTVKTNLDAKYAWKNIEWWWKNTHVNPDTNNSPWVAESKPIWFTEYGFPSVDGATNQPNVFYDPSSSESFFPYHSRGRVDFLAQRTGISATESKWKDSTMITQKFIWTWDARPYPFWPDLKSVWSDTGLWETGHWIQGKFGVSSLADILRDICLKSGLLDSQIDVSDISDLVEGYVVTYQQTARSAIEILRKAYFFDVVERDNVLVFLSGNQDSTESINDSKLIDFNEDGSTANITRVKEVDLPQKVDIGYINKSFSYQVGNQKAQRIQTLSQQAKTINLPIVMHNVQAKNIAEITLYKKWMERNIYEFFLSYKYFYLEPGDRIDVTINNAIHKLHILSVAVSRDNVLKLTAISYDTSVFSQFGTGAGQSGNADSDTQISIPAGDTVIKMLDLPALPVESDDNTNMYIAMTGEEAGWKGAGLYRSDDNGQSYGAIYSDNKSSVIGSAIDVLPDGVTNTFDKTSKVKVNIINGELSAVDEISVLNGANVALLGDEIIQFSNATLIKTGQYELSNLLRGRFGTEHETSNHVVGEDFVLLDSALGKISVPNQLINASRLYKAVSVGQSISDVTGVSYVYHGNSLKPYSPVHIKGVRDSGTGDLTISWIRRTRRNNDWNDFTDVPLNEEFEKYEVDILDNSSQVVRTTEVSDSANIVYSSANQIADFGSNQSVVKVNIYQISARIGRGIAGSGSV